MENRFFYPEGSEGLIDVPLFFNAAEDLPFPNDFLLDLAPSDVFQKSLSIVEVFRKIVPIYNEYPR